jgi:hypothetical protein
MKHQSHRIRGSVAALAVTVAGGASALGLASAAAAHAATTTTASAATSYAFTTLDNQADPTFNQLLGINNNGVAVGFYNDARGHSHAYQVNQATGVFTAIRIPGDVSTQATAISNLGDIAGFGTDAAGVTTSWLLHDGHLTAYQHPGGSDTQAFGINDHDEIVGSYLDGAGVLHGFTLKSPLGPLSHWQTIDDPSGVGSTVVNGVNNTGKLAGFYTDAAGNTDGMLATP